MNLPQTVKAYLSEPAYRVGTEALLAYSSDKTPPEEDPARLVDYYAARAAAELTLYDFARVAYQTWYQFWGIKLAGWQIAEQNELHNAGVDFSPKALFDNCGVTHCHMKKSIWLYTNVHIKEDYTEIAFAVQDKNGTILRECRSFEWIDDDCWDGWLVYRQGCSIADEKFNSEMMLDQVDRAFEKTNELIG